MRDLHFVKRRWAVGPPLLAALLAGSPAAAQPKPPRPAKALAVPGADVEGTVLAIEKDELVIDLGSVRGAVDGATVELWRPVKLKHPVTHQLVSDRFRIGALELLQVRKTIALARPSGALARSPEVGDVVIMARKIEEPAPAPGPAPPGEPPPAAPEDPEARAVTELFEGLKGADPATRAAAYERHAAAHPRGRFSQVLLEEALALHELLLARKPAAARGETRPSLRGFAAPDEVLAGSPVRIAVELDGPAAGAVLHVRKKGAANFVSFPMSGLGPGYFGAVIPAADVTAPALEYFVEAAGASGGATAVVARADAPRELEVFDPPRPSAPAAYPARLQISTDYADYNRLRGNDRAWQTEGDFGLRFGDRGVRALHLGFGVYRGVGGAVDDLDRLHLDPRRIGLTYGYLEAEFGLVSAFSFLTRVAVGLDDGGVAGGGQLLLRIGSDLKTNLLFGGELLGAVGLRGIAQLELAVFERFPILLRAEVTNQPAGSASFTDAGHSSGSGDIGGRGIAQLGFKITNSLMVAARGSFQGRTIQHAGPGFGGAMSYSW